MDDSEGRSSRPESRCINFLVAVYLLWLGICLRLFIVKKWCTFFIWTSKLFFFFTGVWQWKVFTRNFPIVGSRIDIRPHNLQTPREAWLSENLKGWWLCRKKVGNKSPGNVKVFSTPRSTWPILGKFRNVISSKNRQHFFLTSIMSQFKISQFPSQERNADKECNNCQVAGAGFHELRQSITGAASVHKLLPSTKEAWNLSK